jgi:hypothetical protein
LCQSHNNQQQQSAITTKANGDCHSYFGWGMEEQQEGMLPSSQSQHQYFQHQQQLNFINPVSYSL